MTCEPPKLKQYRDLQTHLIGDQSINVDGLCASSNYCVPFFGSTDTKTNTNTTNNVLCANCKEIGGNLNNIYYGTGANDTISSLVKKYNSDYCALFSNNKTIAQNLLTTNKNLNTIINSNGEIIRKYNGELDKQQLAVRENITAISRLNENIGSSKAQTQIKKEDNVYVGASSVGLGFEISSQSYFWTMLGVDVALLGILIYLLKKNRNS